MKSRKWMMKSSKLPAQPPFWREIARLARCRRGGSSTRKSTSSRRSRPGESAKRWQGAQMKGQTLLSLSTHTSVAGYWERGIIREKSLCSWVLLEGHGKNENISLYVMYSFVCSWVWRKWCDMNRLIRDEFLFALCSHLCLAEYWESDVIRWRGW